MKKFKTSRYPDKPTFVKSEETRITFPEEILPSHVELPNKFPSNVLVYSVR